MTAIEEEAFGVFVEVFGRVERRAGVDPEELAG